MRRFFRITNKLKWLFLLAGFIGTQMGIPYSGWLSLVFVVLVIIEPGAMQGLYQLVGIPIIYVTHGFKLPSKESYVSKNDYILPFTGQWTVVNGGFDKSLSHSWNMGSQRYAYDFFNTCVYNYD